jgi:hypothetical protein
MKRYIRSFVMLGIVMILGLTACRRTVVKVTVVTPPAPTPTTSPKSFPLATPYAQEPAAGICASFEGQMVTVSINPDIPDPRCSKIQADQKLTIINRTQNSMEVSIGRFTDRIEPGAQTIIDTPFGEYLAPGIHQLKVSPCCGAELWLEGK